MYEKNCNEVFQANVSWWLIFQKCFVIVCFSEYCEIWCQIKKRGYSSKTYLVQVSHEKFNFLWFYLYSTILIRLLLIVQDHLIYFKLGAFFCTAYSLNGDCKIIPSDFTCIQNSWLKWEVCKYHEYLYKILNMSFGTKDRNVNQPFHVWEKDRNRLLHS